MIGAFFKSFALRLITSFQAVSGTNYYNNQVRPGPLGVRESGSSPRTTNDKQRHAASCAEAFLTHVGAKVSVRDTQLSGILQFEPKRQTHSSWKIENIPTWTKDIYK